MADKPQKPSRHFLFGNVVLAVALVVLLMMGRIWEAMGVFAMVLWLALVGVGIYLLMQDRNEPPTRL